MPLYSIALATFLVATSQQFVLSSTVSSQKTPYEDDPNNFEHQHASELLCSSDTFYMLNRTYTPQLPSECVSVKVSSGRRNGTYQALLRHRLKGSKNMYSLNVTVHPFTSESHTEDNALFFTFPSPHTPLYKFLFTNPDKTCAVLRATHEQDGTGCELYSVAEEGAMVPISQECLDVYIRNCPNTASEVWKDDCIAGDQD
ncbi:uncharacterized protein LOC115313540 [Ixodes scapularis]|uniref:uncharacterized protein LOC115313540 n=1 Tax=Ixodes scapularis TaxID=6945 RepID=UPI001A9F86F6|nr:uncharacterized protein LOC115313540 [Ixodes scapularis]